MFKALIWDIYGTLLLTPGGGIPPEADKNTYLRRGFEVLGKFIGFSPKEDNISSYFSLISEQHEARRRARGITYPEIDIILLWQEFFRRHYDLQVPLQAVREGALLFEEAVNPVVPVEGMAPLLRGLHKKKIRMGLGSNSQFYTLHYLTKAYPGIFPSFFHPGLWALSYEIGAGKPDPLFYETLKQKIKREGLAPGECLFIGNDEENDVRFPDEYGLRSLLFTPGGGGKGVRTARELAEFLEVT